MDDISWQDVRATVSGKKEAKLEIVDELKEGISLRVSADELARQASRCVNRAR